MIKYCHIIPKIRNRIAVEKNLFWKYCDLDRVSFYGYVGYQNADSLKRRLVTMLGLYNNILLSEIDEKDYASIMHSAQQALNHKFDILGSGPYKLDPIDWQIDFKSGVRWEKVFYRDIVTPQGADIKVPWELSRCQHLLWLGEAWLLSGQEEFAQEVINQIKSWIDDNPLMYTVNWKCSMDVAFRAINWIYSLNMISSYKGFDDDFAIKVSRSLWQHGFFIINNLEKIIPYSNNHYTSDLVGLLYLGALFSNSKVASKWLKFAYKEYCAEMHKQVLPSGVHYEKSVSYHRLMVEMMSYPLYMLRRLEYYIEPEIINLISKMYEFVEIYIKPNGLAPLIADNDDGRFLPFVYRDFRDHRYLGNIKSVENRIVALGQDTFGRDLSADEILYDDAGIAIVHKQNDYLYINNSGYSKFPELNDLIIPTHTHNDLLSFELSLNGIDILVDSGAYLYTSSKNDRDAFRSTYKHNTVVVDNEEQNELIQPFYLKRNVQIGKLKKCSHGQYIGDYCTIAGKMKHERLFSLENDGLTIVDTLTKQGASHIAKLFFHFAEGVLPSVENNCCLLCTNGVKLLFATPPSHIEIIDDNISPSFGILVGTKTAIATYNFNEHINITTTITYGNE